MEFIRKWAWDLSEDAPLLAEYREVAVCVLLKHKPTQKPVLVVASRFSNSQNEDVLAWQAHALLRRLARPGCARRAGAGRPLRRPERRRRVAGVPRPHARFDGVRGSGSGADPFATW